MKKFTKGMLIAAGIFGAVGIGLTTAGGVMGASMSELTGVESLKRVLLVADGDYDYDDSDDYDDDDDYDDYDLVEPIAGVLRMCYADGQLKMCLKNQHKQMVKNDGFGDYQFDEAKAVVVEFKQFDNNVNSKRFDVKM